MSRRTLLVRLAGAAIGIVAIAFAAATIDDPIETGGDGGAGGEGEGNGAQPVDQPVDEPVRTVEIPAFLEYLLLVALVIVAIVLAWYLINHRRRAVKVIAAFLVLALVGMLLAHGIAALGLELGGEPEPPEQEPPENESGGEPGMGDGEGDRMVETDSIGFVLLALSAVAAIFIGALVLSRRDTGPPDGEEAIADEEGSEQATAVSAAAGRAAERIESGGGEDVDNEVYRAWREMTRLLEVERPETATPGEFADSAIEAGIDREDVTDLTRLFEDVRYGHRETTEIEERRAVEILRRIESEYGEEER